MSIQVLSEFLCRTEWGSDESWNELVKMISQSMNYIYYSFILKLFTSFIFKRPNSHDWLRKNDTNWRTTKYHTAKQKEYSIQIIPFNFMNQPDGHQTELLSLNYFAITWLINCSKVRFWSDFNCWNGPKTHLRRELKWPKIAQSRSLKSCDHEFGRENQCTKIATPCICKTPRIKFR